MVKCWWACSKGITDVGLDSSPFCNILRVFFYTHTHAYHVHIRIRITHGLYFIRFHVQDTFSMQYLLLNFPNARGCAPGALERIAGSGRP